MMVGLGPDTEQEIDFFEEPLGTSAEGDMLAVVLG